MIRDWNSNGPGAFLGVPAEISNSVEWKRKKAPQASP